MNDQRNTAARGAGGCGAMGAQTPETWGGSSELIAPNVWRTRFYSALDQKGIETIWCGLCGLDWREGHDCVRSVQAEREARENGSGTTIGRGLESEEARERRLAEKTAAELATCEEWRALCAALFHSGRITRKLWERAVNAWAAVETACDGEPRTWAIDALPTYADVQRYVAAPTREEAM